jgi:phosphoglycerate dehydrogenase-like enzyme
MHILVSDQLVEHYGGRMRAVAPGVEFVRLCGDRTFDGDIGVVEAACLTTDVFERGLHLVMLRSFESMRALRWFHGAFVGMDHPIFREIAGRGVTITNSPGVSAQPIAQYVLAMMLRHAKNIPAWERAQRERAWRRVASDELTGKTVALVGLGGIGAEVARLARAFDMRVIGMRRRPELPANVDELFTPERLHDMLAQADYLVLAAPLTAETHGLIDAAALAAMKPTAYLVNVARGQIVVESALIDVLSSGKIAGAALDVFDQEPLPADSPFWSMENVIVTPHNSATSPRLFDRGALVFVDNLRRYAAGDELQNIVEFDEV